MARVNGNGNGDTAVEPPAPPQHLDAGLLLSSLLALKKGDFTVRLPVDRTGVAGKIYDALNDVIDLNDQLNKELRRINGAVGKEGRIH